MIAWREIFDGDKDAGRTRQEVFDAARQSGYPMFCHEGKIFRIGAKGPVFDFEETGAAAEMLNQPDVFCVMNSERTDIAANELGPVLFLNPVFAKIFAEKIKGVPELLWKALYECKKFREEHPLTLPKSRLILPS